MGGGMEPEEAEDDIAAGAAALANEYLEEDPFTDEAMALAFDYTEEDEEETHAKMKKETTPSVNRVVGAITGIVRCVPPQAEPERKKGPGANAQDDAEEE